MKFNADVLCGHPKGSMVSRPQREGGWLAIKALSREGGTEAEAELTKCTFKKDRFPAVHHRRRTGQARPRPQSPRCLP